MKEKLADLIRSGYVRQSICNSDGIPVMSYDVPLVDEDHVELLVDYLVQYGVSLAEWVPVTERLPLEEYNEYKERWQDDELPAFLVMVKDAAVSHMLYFDGENWCRDMRGNLFLRPVTHWMNMPEPPAKD